MKQGYLRTRCKATRKARAYRQKKRIMRLGIGPGAAKELARKGKKHG